MGAPRPAPHGAAAPVHEPQLRRANLATAFVYGAVMLGGLSTALHIQEEAGYSAVVAGLITLPSPVMSLLFARRVGRMAARIGPKVFLMTGPVPAGSGLLRLAR